MADHDIDAQLAARLADAHPDVPDDGFTDALMLALPVRTAPAAPSPGWGSRWMPAIAACTLVACTVPLLFGGGADTGPGLVDRLAATPPPSADELGGLLRDLPALLETHLYTLVAAALCAATMLTPQLLED